MTKKEQQQLGALELANRARLAQADQRRAIAAMAGAEGRQFVASMLRDPTEAQERMRCGYMIRAIDRFGPARTKKLIRKAGLAAGRLDRPIGELSVRERHAIADLLEDLEGPAVSNDFTHAELALIREFSEALAERIPEKRDAFHEIASKCEAAA